MKIVEFFNTDFGNYAGYDNYRKIAGYVDGFKPSARKCIYTVIDKKINQSKKLSIVKAVVSEYTNYLHGDGSLVGVMVNLAQNFVGSNNIPLLKREGNFGKRWKPVASADRYIFTCKEDNLEDIFMPEDYPVLIEQVFEGDKIEPKYFVPILPMILINGSEGISVGFAQKILPRNPKEIYSAIKNILDNKKNTEELLPYYKGFKGTISKREDGGFEIKGNFKKIGLKIVIDELPIGYDLKSYLKVLNTLEEKKIIDSYRDLTDTKKDEFLFEVRMKNIESYSYDEMLDRLKLIKRVSENFTVMDENNKVVLLKDQYDILDRFVKIRLDYYEKRKEYQIEKFDKEISVLKNRLMFLKEVVSGKLIIYKKSKQDIINHLENTIISKIEDSYDYLLRMPIYSLTQEKIDELIKEYECKINLLNELKMRDLKEWYKSDLEKLFSKMKD